MSVLGVPKVSDGSIRWHSGLVTHGVKLLEPAPRDRSVTAMRYLPKLRKVLNCSSAMFKSQTQMDVVAAVHECRSDLLVIMPTGSGKTLCVLLPVVLEGEGRSTIFIVPLVALREELLERAKRMGLSVGTWENREEKGYCQVYIFSVEHVDSKKFREFVRILIDMGRLARIVVDEVHLTLAWGEFRPVLSRLRHMLRAVNSPVQRVLLSATVPPCDRVNTLRAHGLQWAVLHWMPTVRRNLSFQVEKVDVIRVGGKFLSAEASLVEAAVQKGISAVGGFVERGEVGRVMIIGLKKECVGRIVEGLAKGFVDDEKRAENRGENVGQGVVHSKKVVDVMQYHGGLDKGVRKEVHSVWNMDDRKSKIIVCTSAFGTGVDVENVRVVVHVGGCCSLVQYAQEVGRAGRDGKRAKCIVLYNGKYAAWFMRTMESEYGVKGGAGFREGGIQESQAVAFSEFTQWAENEKVCRRNSLYGFLDGVEPGLCVFDEKSVLCDVCEVLNERAVGAFAVEDEKGGMGGEVGDGAVIRQSEVNSEEREVQCEGGGGGDRNVPVSFVTRRMESGVGSGGEEMGTVEVNKSFARDVEKREDKILEKLRSLARRWMGICMRCLAIRMREMKVGGCSCVGKFYCYRCQCTGHAVRNCRIESKQKDKCYRCWMNFCCGERIHDSGFGCAECPFQHLRALAWNLWRCRESRVGMLEEVCTKEEREKLKACAGDEVFYNWLMKQSEVPVIVRLSLWWEGKLRGEEVEISGRAEN